MLLGLESTWHRAAYLARQELYFDQPLTVEETLAGIDAVTVEDVGAVARDLLTPAPLSLAVLGDVDGWTVAADQLRVTV
jgi:predicted Zn-dependent peptidase